MKNVELKILKLKDKRVKAQAKLDVIDSKLKSLQDQCKHPSTKKVWGEHGDYDVACIICSKILESYAATGYGYALIEQCE